MKIKLMFLYETLFAHYGILFVEVLSFFIMQQPQKSLLWVAGDVGVETKPLFTINCD